MSEQDWLEKDFYTTLGVAKDADQAAIKKAYRKLARTWHPDQNPGDAAAEAKFKDIGEAYSVLSNPDQRRRYDALRSMAGGGARFTPGSGGFDDLFGGAFPNGSNIRFSTSGGGSNANLNDLFSGLFNGMGGSGRGASFGSGAPPFGGYGGGPGFAPGDVGAQPGYGGPHRGTNRRASMTITFREALDGAKLKITVDAKKITVKVPAGVKDGQKIRLRGKGNPSSDGGQPGDLEVTIHVESHPVYGREGSNLTMILPVTFDEAVLGATIPVPLIDGSSVKVKVAAGTSSGTVLRVRGRGVKTATTTGDLLVTVEIVVPQSVTEEQAEAVRQLSDVLAQPDPRAQLAQRAGE
ncbi:DnaJ domain-containing protein [Schaalia sp. ZJ405]|uniref:DnaJ C-terminal domain-containing protein n=1 Tax=Schaalia sp. ZJ405 TaxID=2709403 RepID=UPI0013EB98FD|nr:DnaJ C-terminal domain-containing protein [Schaalia sp. ZJ405]QPK81068.1 DnaJ domain-containing protein [Schaalia sp. ZJ405]